ncbi:hypothetical protein HHL11_19440 [Ramlibacter sp. G-1-2-2]|uniref:Uncharacterized protein n=1 Tax=Ramlibacter agri TaxID=2728837 RepID=A0A848H7N2_9BURK|nr:hypothetical protein [Ramlibacter agri]NML45932.1 hypothetical protein [Ramlibacter agri]
MHIKKRGNNALLYRSTWVRKGAEENDHGFSRQVYVASLPLQATEIPSDTDAKLTPLEREFVEQRVVGPARQGLARCQADAQKRARDPLWRLEEGLRLVREASALSAQGAVPAARVRELHAAVASIQFIGASSQPAERDPLEAAVESLRNAARAVANGHYGPAPEEGVRKSPIYVRWLEISEQVDGSAPDGLLRQLQARGWVKAKAR